MDPVSHVVLGHALIWAHRDATRPVRGRGLAITLGALAPDIDILIAPTGWDRYLAAHEIGTHSALGAVVCGVLAAGLARILRRDTGYRPLVGPAVVAGVSHVAADLLSGATIRLGWPLVEGHVSNLGVVAMAEPWFVAMSAMGGLAMVMARQTSRATRSGLRTSHIAQGLLAAFALFTVIASVSRERAEDAYRQSMAARDATGVHLTEPVWRAFGNWRIIDHTATSVRAFTVSSAGAVALDLDIPTQSGEPHLVAASLRWETVRNFRRAHDFAFARATERSVEWSDVRYCWSVDNREPPRCGVWAGGEFSTPPQLGRLVVRVGDLVQTR